MNINIKEYTIDRINDVILFETNLRKEEDFWLWNIDDEYINKVTLSFSNPSFNNAISFLAYNDNNEVVGRIDASLITSLFDGTIKAYLDWICVIKSYRHKRVAQALLKALIQRLKEMNIDTLVGLTAENEEAQRFYRNIPNAQMKDIGIWIDINTHKE